MVSLNKALLNPYFWGGVRIRGGSRLTSHDMLDMQEPGEEEDEEPDLSPCVASVVLAIATVLTSYSTDFLIDSIEGTFFFWGGKISLEHLEHI